MLWVCRVDFGEIENPSNLSNFLSVKLLNHDFKKKSLGASCDNEKYIIAVISVSASVSGLIFTVVSQV